MENKSHAFAAGAFVLAVATLVVGLFIWLARDTSTQRVFEMSTRESVSGLQSQAAVRFRGINVGKVDSIGFDPKNPGNVLVRVAVSDEAPITAGTFGSLGYQGVTGLAYVALDDSGDKPGALATSADAPGRIPMRPSLLSQLSDQGAVILKEVQDAATNFKTLLNSDNQKAMLAAIQNVGVAADGLSKLTSSTNKVLAEQFAPDKFNLPALVQEAQASVKSAQVTAAAFTQTAKDAQTTIKDFGAVAKRLNDSAGVIDRMGQTADTFSATANSMNQNTLPRMNRAAADTSKAANSTERFFTDLKENPQSLIYGAGAIAPGPGEPGFAAPRNNLVTTQP